MNIQILSRTPSFPVILGTDVRRETIHLHAKEILRLENPARGTSLTCLEGVVWVTLPGEAEDHILRANETIPLTRKGLILAQALPEAIVRL